MNTKVLDLMECDITSQHGPPSVKVAKTTHPLSFTSFWEELENIPPIPNKDSLPYNLHTITDALVILQELCQIKDNNLKTLNPSLNHQEILQTTLNLSNWLNGATYITSVNNPDPKPIKRSAPQSSLNQSRNQQPKPKYIDMATSGSASLPAPPSKSISRPSFTRSKNINVNKTSKFYWEKSRTLILFPETKSILSGKQLNNLISNISSTITSDNQDTPYDIVNSRQLPSGKIEILFSQKLTKFTPQPTINIDKVTYKIYKRPVNKYIPFIIKDIHKDYTHEDIKYHIASITKADHNDPFFRVQRLTKQDYNTHIWKITIQQSDLDQLLKTGYITIGHRAFKMIPYIFKNK